MRKKLATMLLAAVMAVGLLPLSACSGTGETQGTDGSAAPATSEPPAVSDAPEPSDSPELFSGPTGEVLSSGEAGESMTWALYSDGTLVISGTGAMEDYMPDDPSIPWFEHRDGILMVVIEDGVASIGEFAFCRCSSLMSVIIPDSVTNIGIYAFHECYSLMRVTIPDSVTYIGDSVFAGCTSLASIEVASGNADYTAVDGVLFSAEQTLLHTYPAGKSGNFYSIPASVTSIGAGAFCGCSRLTSITIPDSVTSIEWGAFWWCSSLTSIIIPDSVTSIGEWAFVGCSSLTSVTIPDSVTSIGDYAFYECSGLTDIYYGSSEAQWGQIDMGEYNDELLNATIHYNS